MTRRRLTLKREALAELTTGQLGSVAGASGECVKLTAEVDCETFTQPPAYCLTLAGPRCIF